MELRVGRAINLFYVIVLSLLLISFSVGLYYYWTVGSMNIDNINAIIEGSIHLNQLKSKRSVEKIKDLVINDEVRKAIKLMEQVEHSVKILNSVTHFSYEFGLMKSSMKSARKSLSGLLSFPELSTVMNVLDNKAKGFESFVIKQNWRTLSRTIRRVRARLSNDKRHREGFFNYNEIRSLVKGIEFDIERMTKVTKGSILSGENKFIVISKLKFLKIELSMLKKYLKGLEKFNNDEMLFRKNYIKWFKKIELEIAYMKIQLEKDSRTVLFYLLGMIIFLFFSIPLGTIIYRKSYSNLNRSIERTILRSIKEGIIPYESKFKAKFTSSFFEEFDKFRLYVHNRMNFGMIFQETVPFSAILLDSNLKLIWANKLFYESWDMEAHKDQSENLSWDFLQRFTNLGENDPVLEALNGGIAGIYQIQVKTGLTEEVIPYEMYVSPIKHIGETRIMIFFYPLRSLEETLQNQTKSLVGPIVRTLDKLISDEFDLEFQEKIVKDFQIAGIEKIYDRFLNFNKLIEKQRSEFLSEIRNKENNLYDQFKMMDDVKAVIDEKRSLYLDILKKFEKAKEDIIYIVEIRKEFEQIIMSNVNGSKTILKDHSELIVLLENMSETLNESLENFASLYQMRQHFKELKNDIDEFKYRIIQMLDQTLMFQKSDDLDAVKLDQVFSKIKIEIKQYEKTLSTFSQAIMNMDITLSKIQLISEGKKTCDLTKFFNNLEVFKERVENSMFGMNKFRRDAEDSDNAIIKSLKNLYDSFKKTESTITAVSKLTMLNNDFDLDKEEDKKACNNEINHDINDELIYDSKRFTKYVSKNETIIS